MTGPTSVVPTGGSTVEETLRETCRSLLASGAVQAVIGYGADDGGEPAPVFVTDPARVGQLVFDHRCHQNLTTYLTRPEVKALGRVAVVVKGCDERAAVMLEKEAQLDRAGVHLIGVACTGVGDPVAPGCRTCDAHLPRHSDDVIGEAENPPVDAADRYAELDAFLQRPAEERFAHWMSEFSRCTRCYACRQVCPLCYCRVCVMDKNRPQIVDTGAHLKGTLAFQITRAFHLAGRCVGCGACTRACPAGIDLSLLTLSVARAAEQEFGVRPGTDPQDDLLVGGYSTNDREGFIR